MLAAIPVGIAMAALTVWLWSRIIPLSELGIGIQGFSATITLLDLLRGSLYLMGFVLLHELLHAVPVMLTGSRDDLVIGFWPRHFVPYFATLGAVPRNMQLVSGALPFVSLTLMPLLIAAGMSVHVRWLVVISSLNAAACGADLMVFVLYCRQIPAKALVRNQGYSTWWKPRSDPRIYAGEPRR